MSEEDEWNEEMSPLNNSPAKNDFSWIVAGNMICDVITIDLTEDIPLKRSSMCPLPYGLSCRSVGGDLSSLLLLGYQLFQVATLADEKILIQESYFGSETRM